MQKGGKSRVFLLNKKVGSNTEY